MSERIFTVSHFKEILKPGLSQRKIYIRKDEEELNEGDDIDYAKRVAEVIPLIRLGDFVIHRDNITFFSIEIGNTLLPRITFTFTDEYQRARKMLTSKKDFITVYYGNAVDEYYIKQEYILSDIFCDPDSDDVTLDGYLYIPEFFKQYIRYFNEENDAETSWKVIKKICEECQLGFFTNIDDTNDAQTWLQDNCTTQEFIEKTIMQHAFVSSDTCLIMFIDQYDYFNLIDIKKAYSNRELERTSKYPMTGLPIIEEDVPVTKDVILTSARYLNDDTYPFKIESYTTNFRFGSRLMQLPDHIEANEYNISQLPFEIEENEVPMNTHEVDHRYYIQDYPSDVHRNYKNVLTESRWVDMFYDQGDEVTAKMVAPIMLLYPYQYVPLRLYLPLFRPEYDDAKEDKTVTELDAEKPRNDQDEVFDELHSGDYIIRSIRYEYSSAENENKQYVTFTRLPLETIPEIKQL